MRPESKIHPDTMVDGGIAGSGYVTPGARMYSHGRARHERTRGSFDRYIDYGRLIFGVWMIENELRCVVPMLRCS